MNPSPAQSTPTRGLSDHGLSIGLLLFLCSPWGFAKLRRRRAARWVQIPYGLVGLPIFVVVYGLVAIVVGAVFLPPLDLAVGDGLERTIRYKEGNYASTFLKTAKETNGAYELIRVEIQPKGGNSFHYHRTFEETFTAVEGNLTVLVGDREHVLKPGESITAHRGALHTFNNPTDKTITMEVRVTPARGLEKSIRVAYGMSNTGKWAEGSLLTKVWRVALMLGYSETYVAGVPRFIEEPLINAVAKIAQWVGADEDLEQFFQHRSHTSHHPSP